MCPHPPFRPEFPTKVFTEVPFPGHPLGIAVDGETFYVGTDNQVSGEPNVPSHVYAYDKHGEIQADYTITGQDAAGQGITGIALDHDGVLYLVEQAPARVITLDPKTGEQELYAELPDVPLCSAGGEPGNCSAAGTDRPSQPINLVFDPAGNLYIGDLTQALIWRVPRGGGSAEVWYTAADLDSLFGPNTVRFLDYGRTLLFAESATGLLNPADLPTAKGRLYKLTINDDGTPGERTLFWEGTQDGDVPDGFAVSENGNVYVALAVGNAVVVIDPEGKEIARIPREGQMIEPPFDTPGGVAFYGNTVLVTNHVFFGGPEERNVVYSVKAHERGKRLFRPRVRR